MEGMYPKPQVAQLREIRHLIIQKGRELLHEHIGAGEDMSPRSSRTANRIPGGRGSPSGAGICYVLLQHSLEVVEDAP